MDSTLWAIVDTAAVVTVIALLLANVQRPERRLKHRPDRLYGSDAPDFRRAIGSLLGPAVVGGNRIRTLQNGDAIFGTMLDAIRRAEQSVTFEQFIFRDPIAIDFCNAMSEAAGRGVQVRVLLDWVGAKEMDAHALQCLRDSGAEVELYHQPKLRHLGRINNRTHRKLMVVDGRVGYTGGACVGREWTGHAQDPQHWRDTHYEVHGPVVAQMQSAFVDNWIKTTGTVLHGDRYFPALCKEGEAEAQMLLSSPAGGANSMHLMMLLALTAAQRTIDLENSYFVPDELTMQALLAARRRGVRVRVVTPNRHTDAKIGRWATHGLLQPLLSAGAEVYEYQPTMIHCKVLVVDGRWVTVGSANFDNRSFRLNDEANLTVFDEGFAGEQIAMIETDLEHCERIQPGRWKRRPFGQRIYERTALLLRSQL
jgi:cardiolipin synthase